MKIKIFFQKDTLEEFENKINEFIKDKKIIDIKHQMSSYGYCNDFANCDCMDMSILVMYEEMEEK